MLFKEGNTVIFKSNKRIKQENPNAKVYDWIQGVPRKGNEQPDGCVRIGIILNTIFVMRMIEK